MNTLRKGIVMGLLATFAGMFLQCASDPRVSGDGGVIDQLLADMGVKDRSVRDSVPDSRTPDTMSGDSTVVKPDTFKFDSIGPKADAATDGGSTTAKSVTRRVVSGTLTTTTQVVCDPAWTDDDPPITSLWMKGTTGLTRMGDGFVSLANGCLSIYKFSTPYQFRLVIVH